MTQTTLPDHTVLTPLFAASTGRRAGVPRAGRADQGSPGAGRRGRETRA
jgi:hypothetical protein